MGLSYVLVTLATAVFQADAFANNAHPSLHPGNHVRRSKLSMAKSPSSETQKATLTKDTTWRLRLLLNDVTSSQGRKLNGQLFVLEGTFIEEEGYEPPQGTFQPVQLQNDGADGQEGGTTLEISRSRWILSEDPNDRKDGLWIWGLFKEPLYPFMLLQLETKELYLSPGGSKGNFESRDSIPPLKLYAQISHVRNDEVGVELQPANLNVRVLERVQLPGASVDLFEEERIGQVSFQSL